MKRILVAVDFDDTLKLIIETAEVIAERFQSKIRLVHTEPEEPAFVSYEPGPQYIRDNVANEYRNDMRQLEKITSDIIEKGLDAECRQIQGPVLEKIIEEVELFEADLLIIGSHPHSIWHNLFQGNISERLIKKAPCKRLVIPEKALASKRTENR